jgi:hypothetical protein
MTRHYYGMISRWNGCYTVPYRRIPYYSMPLYAVLCCTTLYCVVVYCTALYRAALYCTVLCWLCCVGRRLVSLIAVGEAGQLYLFSTSTRNLRSRSSPRTDGWTTSQTAETPDSEHWYHPHYEESRPSKGSTEPSLPHKGHGMLSEEALSCLHARPKILYSRPWIQDSGLLVQDSRAAQLLRRLLEDLGPRGLLRLRLFPSSSTRIYALADIPSTLNHLAQLGFPSAIFAVGVGEWVRPHFVLILPARHLREGGGGGGVREREST